MISKGYTTDIAYSAESAKWLDAWVWSQAKSPIPISFVGEAGEEILVGQMRPIRWWRQTTRREGLPNVDHAMLYFSVKHAMAPTKRMGDFCGLLHGIRFELSDDSLSPKKAIIEKR